MHSHMLALKSKVESRRAILSCGVALSNLCKMELGIFLQFERRALFERVEVETEF